MQNHKRETKRFKTQKTITLGNRRDIVKMASSSKSKEALKIILDSNALFVPLELKLTFSKKQKIS